MSKMQWDESFSVGVEEIDVQHRRWIGLINQLHDAMMARQGGVHLSDRILSEMLDYATFHFTFEEDYLRHIGFPELKKHRQHHQQFMRDILQKLGEGRGGGLVLNTEVMSLLAGWLRNHILQEDLRYAEYIRANAN